MKCRIKTKKWMNRRGITFERYAPDTHDQNGVVEIMGRIIMEKARAMRLSAKFPHALWKEIIAAAYLPHQHGRLQKYKARLVVLGNLPTRATNIGNDILSSIVGGDRQIRPGNARLFMRIWTRPI
jgi:hypothetical protein